jgi:arginyl-tRNA--protein-N-Asp/Glu arginylyltransferase
MLVELHYPESLTNEELDTYLANGWFRMGQSIFTTNFLKFHDVVYSALWLRIDLLNFEISKVQQKLIKMNAQFEVVIQKVQITIEQENLFSKYSQSVSFDPAPSAYHLLCGHNENRASLPLYDTFEINIYDQTKLIATGFFDFGKESTAGISCFYDPDYKKYSLGKYLMYLKMDFSKKAGCRFFYPGYFAPKYPLFDYKLDLAKPFLQYLDLVTDKWLSFAEYSPSQTPLEVMHHKLRELSQQLENQNVKHQFKYYDFFDADMISNLNGLGLFDFPMFLFCFEFDEEQLSNTPALLPMVVFDVQDAQYHLIICSKTYKSIFEECKEEHYNAYLLQLTRFLYKGESAEEMAEVIAMYGCEIEKVELGIA